MQIDFRAPLLTLRRQPLMEDGEVVTVGTVVMQLIATQPTDGQIAPSARKMRFGLTLRLISSSDGLVEVTDAEKAMVAELLNKSIIAPLYAEQVALALDGQLNPLAGNAGSNTRKAANGAAVATE